MALRGCVGVAVLLISAVAAAEEAPSYADAKQILSERCVPCHSANPDLIGVYEAPQGVRYDTSEAIRAFTPGILKTAVQARTMPPANLTEMTDSERQRLGAWIAAGAQTQ